METLIVNVRRFVNIEVEYAGSVANAVFNVQMPLGEMGTQGHQSWLLSGHLPG